MWSLNTRYGTPLSEIGDLADRSMLRLNSSLAGALDLLLVLARCVAREGGTLENSPLALHCYTSVFGFETGSCCVLSLVLNSKQCSCLRVLMTSIAHVLPYPATF